MKTRFNREWSNNLVDYEKKRMIILGIENKIKWNFKNFE